MIFKRIEPDKALKRIIECFWFVEDGDPSPRQQKIIPDGFAEIIFHLADPYRIRLEKKWELQSKALLAGQISKYFFLENTGRSGIVGIKLKPCAITLLFGLSMDRLTDRVVDLSTALPQLFTDVQRDLHSIHNPDFRIEILQAHFSALMRGISSETTVVERAVDLIFEKQGMIQVTELTETGDVSERQLERLFNKYVGLSPKFFARIIRFSQVFQHVQQKDFEWVDLALRSGYYDQSHFIRNFKAFTGEDPTGYTFEDRNMANFFMKKK